MAERQTSKTERKRERQSISVPFLWEERPGTPKRDWKPIPRPIKPVQVPVKLVVSVPFGWEEKPGTPLQLLLPPPPASCNLDHDQHYSDQVDVVLSDSELETCSFETDESFSSAPSLLANCLIPTVELTHAVPVEKVINNNGELESPGSPVSDAESSASSYETGYTSLVGASFLEWLFPLLVQGSNPANKAKIPEKAADARCSELTRERSGSQVGRPLLTLGEMIVMSRRRSYQRKVINMRKHTSMVTTRRN
ncbi:hydroxyproline-rich glycoprotein [Dorcoceras hygrometricum]|uniref:Hydroxyproline-rich glycoprotein n=1 Tax=Dorcoceras hygrometricum TaxID=472368 RepID=A0A2Z7AWS5_9LAMI|nr:hydroxyproline-rich glycoprotein [Dorcoceras hygrometricum]